MGIQHNPGVKRICATVENEAKTYSMTIDVDESSRHPGRFWSDNIAYIHLGRGCYLQAYEDMNYEGTMNYLQHKKDRNIISKSSADYEIGNDGWIGRWWAN